MNTYTFDDIFISYQNHIYVNELGQEIDPETGCIIIDTEGHFIEGEET